MLDPKFIRENSKIVSQGIQNKGVSFDVNHWLKLDQERRNVINDIEKLKAERNKNSQSISQIKKQGDDTSDLIKKTKELGDTIKKIQDKLNNLDNEITQLSLNIPNLPHHTTPIGMSEADNQVVRSWGNKTKFTFSPKDHLEIGENLKLFDFKRGAKISGRGFAIYTGLGAKLERALIQFFLDTHINENQFTEIIPPLVVNRDAMIGTGQIPKMEDDMYSLSNSNDFLIPTAEVPVTNIHANETLLINELPISYVAYSPCFRKEAGSWGKDTRGFQRLHQFNKVEMVKFVSPENSYEILEQMVTYAEDILKKLNLQYRVLELCSSDLSFAAAKCYDLEVYSPVTNNWLEVSSVSNFESFQARRANIRYKASGKPEFVHTLNGSGLATPRVLVALLENFQTEDGGFKIPEVLQPYMNNLTEIVPN